MADLRQVQEKAEVMQLLGLLATSLRETRFHEHQLYVG
jgi:hypothetical protein